ncbi:MAG: hypothetical protein AAFO91_08890 [Bacteroidota bacterium]
MMPHLSDASARGPAELDDRVDGNADHGGEGEHDAKHDAPPRVLVRLVVLERFVRRHAVAQDALPRQENKLAR